VFQTCNQSSPYLGRDTPIGPVKPITPPESAARNTPSTCGSKTILLEGPGGAFRKDLIPFQARELRCLRCSRSSLRSEDISRTHRRVRRYLWIEAERVNPATVGCSPVYCAIFDSAMRTIVIELLGLTCLSATPSLLRTTRCMDYNVPHPRERTRTHSIRRVRESFTPFPFRSHFLRALQ